MKITPQAFTDMNLSVLRKLLIINMYWWYFFTYSWCQFYIFWYRLHHMHHHSGLCSYLLSDINWYKWINHLVIHCSYISKFLLQWVLKTIIIHLSIDSIPPLVVICHVDTSLHRSCILLLYMELSCVWYKESYMYVCSVSFPTTMSIFITELFINKTLILVFQILVFFEEPSPVCW